MAPALAGRVLSAAPQGRPVPHQEHLVITLSLVAWNFLVFSGTPTSSPVSGKPGQLATLILEHATQTPGKGTTLPQLEMPYILLPYVLMGNVP